MHCIYEHPGEAVLGWGGATSHAPLCYLILLPSTNKLPGSWNMLTMK